MNSDILIAVLLYELLLVGGVGAWLLFRHRKRRAAPAEFQLGGRRLPVYLVAPTLALTVLGTPHIIGIFELSWHMGATAMWFSLAHVIVLAIVCLATGLWLRRLAVTTVPELLELLYGPGVRLVVSCVMAGSIFGVLTLETQGIGIILSAMMGWDVSASVIVGGLLGVLYVVLAGIREVGWINLFNAFLMYAGLIAATIYIATLLPGGNFDTVADHYVNAGNAEMLSIFGSAELLMTFALGLVVALVFTHPVNQPLLQVALSARDESTIVKSLWIAAPVNGLFGVFVLVIGLTANSMPEFAALGPKLAATTMLVESLPKPLVVLLIGSFLAAVLSSFAITALAPATIFSHDIYRRLYRPDASDREIANVTRAAILVLALAAIGIASYLPPILAAIGWLVAWGMPVFWLVISGLFWKRNALAAGITIAVAWVLNSLWSFTGLPLWLGVPEMPNSYVVLLVTVVVGTATNLYFAGKPRYFHSRAYREQVQIAAADGR